MNKQSSVVHGTAKNGGFGRVDPGKIPELVAAMTGSVFRPSDDEPLPHGPWDPIIRVLFDKPFAGPRPEPWQAGIADRGSYASLNPQPLPPRIAFVIALGRQAIQRAELIADFAEHSGGRGGASAYVSELLDDWCGTPPRKFPWPRPGPRPDWAVDTLGALDHLVLASVIDGALSEGVTSGLEKGLKEGHQKLLDTASKQLNG